MARKTLPLRGMPCGGFIEKRNSLLHGRADGRHRLVFRKACEYQQ
jgi:hypothetical protein